MRFRSSRPSGGLAAVVAVCGLCWSGPTPLRAEAARPSSAITIQGSTTFTNQLLAPYQRLVEQRAGVKLDVIANKSIHGLVSLLEGRTSLAMISSGLAGEQAHLRRIRPELAIDKLQAFEVARTRVAFVVHRKNPITKLSVAELRRILLGEASSWAAFSGEDRPIAVVTVQPGGGVPTTVRTRVTGGQPFKPGRMIVVEAPRHVLKIAAQHEGALGIAQLGLVDAGVVKEIETDEPVEQILNLVTLGQPNAILKAIIEASRDVAAEKLL